MSDLVQGTAEWHEHRAKHFNASDAAAMLGIGKYKTRSQLLRERATGVIPEFSAATQALFDRGHEIEAIARTFAEEYLDVPIGESLEPLVFSEVVEGIPLSASLDGHWNGVNWECKTLNAELAAALAGGRIPEHYCPQLEQGLMLSGADKCLFTASDGTRENTFHVWYYGDSKLRATIIAGWKQFAEDIANYRHDGDAIQAVAASHENLPTITIQAFGAIDIRDNLAAFGDALTAYLDRLPVKPETDDDFATLEDAVKRLKAAEEAIDAAENGALAQASSIDEMRRQAEKWRGMARTNRLMFEKLVKSEKENRKATLVTAARDSLHAHLKMLNERAFGYMPAVIGDWQGVIKGLKTLSSIKDKLDAELARAKIEATMFADLIHDNHLMLHEGDQDWMFLFPDFRQMCTLDSASFAAVLHGRIAEHKAKLEAVREKARAEEQAKARAEADAKAQPLVNRLESIGAKVVNANPPDYGATINLGEISRRLGFNVTEKFLSTIGIPPDGHEKNANLYHESRFPLICRAIADHVMHIIDA